MQFSQKTSKNEENAKATCLNFIVMSINLWKFAFLEEIMKEQQLGLKE